jgi:hypothetical protein
LTNSKLKQKKTEKKQNKQRLEHRKKKEKKIAWRKKQRYETELGEEIERNRVDKNRNK